MEAPETTAGPLPQATGEIGQHRDDVEIAQAAGGHLVHESLLAGESRAGARELIAIDRAVLHVEEDVFVVDDLRAVNAHQLYATHGLRVVGRDVGGFRFPRTGGGTACE